jgi:modulator of drug activity B
MKCILIINVHEYYPFSEGRLNNALVERTVSHLTDTGYQVQTTTMKDNYDVDPVV